MKTIEPLVDIFGIAMCVTPKARLREFHSYCAQLFNLGKLNPQVPLSDLLFYVQRGYLSPQSASYYLAGRASEKQLSVLDLFKGFELLCVSRGIKPSKIFQSWQKTKVVRVENTFLFPWRNSTLMSHLRLKLNAIAIKTLKIYKSYNALLTSYRCPGVLRGQKRPLLSRPLWQV